MQIGVFVCIKTNPNLHRFSEGGEEKITFDYFYFSKFLII